MVFRTLKAGASHVTGIEGRDHLVQNANKTFADNGIDSSQFEFVNGDAHDVLTHGVGSFDVVMRLGFVCHTLRYVELFAGIRATGARHVIIDTRVHLGKKRVIAVHSNPVQKEGLAVEDRFSYKGQALVGRPSMAALEHMLGASGYEIASETDWSRIPGPDADPTNKYLTGARVTLLAVARDKRSAPGGQHEGPGETRLVEHVRTCAVQCPGLRCHPVRILSGSTVRTVELGRHRELHGRHPPRDSVDRHQERRLGWQFLAGAACGPQASRFSC